MKMPQIASMNRVSTAPIGPNHTVALFDSIKSAGSVEYTYLLVVSDDTTHKPVYVVASEVNSMASNFGSGSHHLGVFTEAGHFNLGSSDDWGDPHKFFPKALELASETFKKLGV
jgi:hypothetical protein